jgi:hypothetical protein
MVETTEALSSPPSRASLKLPVAAEAPSSITESILRPLLFKNSFTLF